MNKIYRGANTPEFWNSKIERTFLNDPEMLYENLDSMNYMKIAHDIIVENKIEVKNKSILEIGCADGRFINMMSKALPDFICDGYDISEVGINFAREKYAKENTGFDTYDLLTQKLDDNDKFGFICCFETIEHMPPIKNYEIIDDILEHCEYAIISTVDTKDGCDHAGNGPEHISHYDFDSFDKKGYEVIWKQKLSPINMPDGVYHYFIVVLKGKL